MFQKNSTYLEVSPSRESTTLGDPSTCNSCSEDEESEGECYPGGGGVASSAAVSLSDLHEQSKNEVRRMMAAAAACRRGEGTGQQQQLTPSCGDRGGEASLMRSGSSIRRMGAGMAGRPFSDGVTLDDEAPVLPEKVSFTIKQNTLRCQPQQRPQRFHHEK